VSIMGAIIAASEAFGVSPADIIGPSRRQAHAVPRFAAVWVSRKRGYSLPQIGHRLGKRDHTTILSAERRAEKLRATDPFFRSATDCALGSEYLPCCPHCGGRLG